LKFHFDLLAPIYNWIFPPKKPEKLLEILQCSDLCGKILEVGGGTGRTLTFFEPFSDDLWLVEPSKHMLAQAKKKFPKLNTVFAYAEDLPFPDDSFDTIIVVDSLHHWDRQDEGLREVHRVLKPNGKFIIEEIHPRWKTGYMIERMEAWMKMYSTFYQPPELIKLLKSVGFRIKKHGWVRQPTYFVYSTK
jgi:demethylmenaquinone methyltransferase/2-methoxy-6-polyprenyl-1,4-benzoquinol methylase